MVDLAGQAVKGQGHRRPKLCLEASGDIILDPLSRVDRDGTPKDPQNAKFGPKFRPLNRENLDNCKSQRYMSARA